jgi:hypothetical protein
VLAAENTGVILCRSNSQRKEGNIIKTMKTFALAALAALAICLGACASSSQPASTTAPASSGYSK